MLAVVLAGKGISGLQEAGIIGVAPIENVPRIEMLGLYPTVETLGAQVCAVLALVWGFRRSGRARPAASERALPAE